MPTLPDAVAMAHHPVVAMGHHHGALMMGRLMDVPAMGRLVDVPAMGRLRMGHVPVQRKDKRCAR